MSSFRFGGIGGTAFGSTLQDRFGAISPAVATATASLGLTLIASASAPVTPTAALNLLLSAAATAAPSASPALALMFTAAATAATSATADLELLATVSATIASAAASMHLDLNIGTAIALAVLIFDLNEVGIRFGYRAEPAQAGYRASSPVAGFIVADTAFGRQR